MAATTLPTVDHPKHPALRAEAERRGADLQLRAADAAGARVQVLRSRAPRQAIRLAAERLIAQRFPAFSQDLDMILQGCAGHAGSMDTTLPKLPRAFGPFIRMRVAALVRGRRSD